MTVNQFLNYVSYASARPDYISKGRWIGMQEWYKTRYYEMRLMNVGEHI